MLQIVPEQRKNLNCPGRPQNQLFLTNKGCRIKEMLP